MKTTSWITPLGLAFVLGLLTFSQTGCQSPSGPATDHAATFSCPMHPEVTQAGAGACPKCGMKLETKTGGH